MSDFEATKVDVIVVGAGAAGLLAAGRAAEQGAKVLVLEKMRSEGRKLADYRKRPLQHYKRRLTR
jgi:flavin-dependent dehydrogenase